MEPSAVRQALAGCVNCGGRSQIIDRGYVVINDTYNSNPLSLKYALRATGEIFPDRRKIAVLSDMKELGEAADLYHVECGKAVRDNNFDMLLLWGGKAGFYAEGAVQAGLDADAVKQFETKAELSQFLKTIVDDDDVVLIKGSRSMRMEDVVRDLTGGEE